LPRTPAPTPVAVSSLIGRIGPLSGGGHGLGVTVLATAGEGVPQQFLIGGEATCEVAGATKDVSIGLLMFGTDLQPGESQQSARRACAMDCRRGSVPASMRVARAAS